MKLSYKLKFINVNQPYSNKCEFWILALATILLAPVSGVKCEIVLLVNSTMTAESPRSEFLIFQ